MNRFTYIRKRLIMMIFVVFGVTVVIFSMVRVLPGDPAFLMLGERATDATAAALRERLGLNQPIWVQYWNFVTGLVQGNLGNSLLYRQPVSDLVLKRVPVSVFVALYAMVLSAILTGIFGLLAAVRAGTWIDHVIRIALLYTLTTPSFWLGILLILLLSLKFGLFPVAGMGNNFQENLWYLFLPALTLALQLSAVLIRNLRSQIILTFRADYVRTARAKGLGERIVLLRHVVRNALMSTITIFGLQFGYLVGGTVVVETVFAIPGMGQLLYQSILGRDYPVVQAITVISALLVIIVNLIVDLSYSFLDPRVSYE
jgi:peptide/nickel transport system permease protein